MPVCLPVRPLVLRLCPLSMCLHVHEQELPDGILAYGKTEDMVWGSKDHEQLEECPGCVPHSSWQRCPRCELYEEDELYERDAPFLRDMAAES